MSKSKVTQILAQAGIGETVIMPQVSQRDSPVMYAIVTVSKEMVASGSSVTKKMIALRAGVDPGTVRRVMNGAGIRIEGGRLIFPRTSREPLANLLRQTFPQESVRNNSACYFGGLPISADFIKSTLEKHFALV